MAYVISNLLSKTQILFFTESYFEVELVNRLQGVIDKQRGQIKKFEQSNIEYKADNEEVYIHYICSKKNQNDVK